jgi:signal transduction histidine kinase
MQHFEVDQANCSVCFIMLQFLTRVTQQICTCRNLSKVFSQTVEELRQVLQIDRVLTYRFQSNRSGVVIAESVGSPWTVSLGLQIHDPCFAATQVDRYRQGKIQALADIYASNLPQCYLNSLAALEVRANLVVPIVLETPDASGEMHSKLWGLLVAQHCWEAHEWTEETIDLIKQVAILLSFAIQQADLRDQIQQFQALMQAEVWLQTLRPALDELKTPLSSIYLATQTLVTLMERGLLLNTVPDPHRSGEDRVVSRTLFLLQQSCQRQMRLVQNLLGLFEGEELPTPIALNLNQWLPSVLELFRSQVAQRQQIFRVEIAEDLPVIVTDPRCLERILRELLDNATQYTPTGNWICVSAAATPTSVCLSVSNSGSEIAAADRNRIFERFYQVADHQIWQANRMGLGLTIVKQLIDRLGATIRVESGDVESGDRCTRFVIELPR